MWHIGHRLQTTCKHGKQPTPSLSGTGLSNERLLVAGQRFQLPCITKRLEGNGGWTEAVRADLTVIPDGMYLRVR